ncbi:Protein CBG22086 [Caenorhabditis briggsae]|uniref:Protein CBG22086 n=1 Tax=Caenorhabditis briggsae TaxID=6238 RepID=A8Y1H7_CAEBR|nr:Protein CBG22086 [Caenorhabditis briggsae]CAP38746.2 Protein CBG22086 [Caenorhabditis briggsae]
MLCCSKKQSKQAIRVSLIISVLVDVCLCAALFVSLAYYWINGKSFSPHYIVGFMAFFVLFAGFFISLMVAVHTKDIRAILVSVAFTVTRFICAIIVVISWMSEYHSTEEANKAAKEGEDPYEWISHRKAILLAFAGIYIKIFISQLFILNRYYSHAAETEREAKEREIDMEF